MAKAHIRFKLDKYYEIIYKDKRPSVILYEVSKKKIMDTLFICGGQANKHGKPLTYEGDIKVLCIEESAIHEVFELQWNLLKGILE